MKLRTHKLFIKTVVSVKQYGVDKRIEITKISLLGKFFPGNL